MFSTMIYPVFTLVLTRSEYVKNSTTSRKNQGESYTYNSYISAGDVCIYLLLAICSVQTHYYKLLYHWQGAVIAHTLAATLGEIVISLSRLWCMTVPKPK